MLIYPNSKDQSKKVRVQRLENFTNILNPEPCIIAQKSECKLESTWRVVKQILNPNMTGSEVEKNLKQNSFHFTSRNISILEQKKKKLNM